MNIFILDVDFAKAARYHCDKHVVKMILESAQLLCTAHRILDGLEYKEKSPAGRMLKRWRLFDERDSLFYKATHVNHPCALWVRESRMNYVWVYSLLKELCKEYTFRYGKVHKAEREGLVDRLGSFPTALTNHKLTTPPLAMPDEYKTDSVVESYRNYYKKGKANLLQYTKREKPSWLSS